MPDAQNGLRIAFFGSSLVSSYWNGAATYYRGIIRALDARGHRVTFYEPDAWDRQAHRDIDDPPWARVVVYPAEGEAGVLGAMEDARGADVIVKASGVGVHDALLERALPEIERRAGTTLVFWDVDAPATLDRLAADAGDPFHALIPRYDLVLTYGGGPPVVERYLAFGARGCEPIYNALDPDTHHPVAADPRFAWFYGVDGNRGGGVTVSWARVCRQPMRYLPRIALDALESVASAGLGAPTRCANIDYMRRGVACKLPIAHRNHAKLAFFDAVSLIRQPALVAQIVPQCRVIFPLWQQCGRKHGKFDQGAVFIEGHDIDKTCVIGLLHPKIHQGGADGVKYWLLAANKPTTKMLQQANMLRLGKRLK